MLKNPPMMINNENRKATWADFQVFILIQQAVLKEQRIDIIPKF